MKPRITFPRTVVLPKDCEGLWLQVKTDNPAQSFNGWVVNCIRAAEHDTLAECYHDPLDNESDEA